MRWISLLGNLGKRTNVTAGGHPSGAGLLFLAGLAASEAGREGELYPANTTQILGNIAEVDG